MQIITADEQFKSAIEGSGLAIVVFKADWCKDCHFIDPFMPEVVQHYAGQAAFYQIDRDQFPELFADWNVLGIPSFIAFRDGKELVRFVSKLRKTREEIEQFIERAIAVAAALPQA